MSTQIPPGDAVKPPLALIAGPTASGKSELAVRLALAIAATGREAVVVNADSAQLYADLPVLSAAPTVAEQRGVTHRLFGAWDGALACSAADWATMARAEIAAVHARGGVPVLVGGTGLYIRTLLDGIAPVPPIDPDVRAAVRAMAVGDAYAALVRADPDRAALLGPRDAARVARALEVMRSTGRSIAAWQGQRSGGIGAAVSVQALVLEAERGWLHARCEARFAAMLSQGAVEEVRALLDRRLDPALPVMRAIGVREIAGWLNGAWSRDAALALGQRATRQYVKRQQTWLRHQPPPDWTRCDARNSVNDAHLTQLYATLLQY